jgi:hypothetical protein
MTAAIHHLRETQQNLSSASHDKGGHRVKALQYVSQAIAEVEGGIRYDNRLDCCSNQAFATIGSSAVGESAIFG